MLHCLSLGGDGLRARHLVLQDGNHFMDRDLRVHRHEHFDNIFYYVCVMLKVEDLKQKNKSLKKQ